MGNVDRYFYDVNRGVWEKTIWRYTVSYKVDEGDEGREKNMGRVREMRIMGI
jgi:hypothetical protein